MDKFGAERAIKCGVCS